MTRREKKRLENRFLPSLFAAYLGTLLLMSGIHIGLVTLVNERQWNTLIQIMIPVVYWTLVAVGLTVFTRNKIIKTYDQPMKELAKAADKVAHGDFSVYIPPLHTTNRHDYLDLMFLDFNKMVAELGSIETMRTDFIANVSHELKTPIALIQGYAEGLTEGMAEDEDSRNYYCEVIMDEAGKMNKMVKQLLTLTALEFGNDMPVMERFDITALIRGILASAGILLQQKEARVVFEQKEPVWVWADEFKIEDVITNYLNNAMNHLDG